MRKKLNLVGEVYGRLSVISLAKEENKRRFWYCKCSCGSVTIVEQQNMRRGYTTSCGCFQRENMSSVQTTHGCTKTRLYRCWKSMKDRSMAREDCEIFEGWELFSNFKDWALTNGYDDSKILCRNGDRGDYKPSNCRWDTPQSNSEEALAKVYRFISPSGEEIEVFNLSKFCKDNKLNQGAMFAVWAGLQRRKSHKGYKAVIR